MKRRNSEHFFSEINAKQEKELMAFGLLSGHVKHQGNSPLELKVMLCARLFDVGLGFMVCAMIQFKGELFGGILKIGTLSTMLLHYHALKAAKSHVRQRAI